MRSSELLKNPYPAFKRLRLDSPVSRLEPEGYWLIARHADVLAVLKNPELFRSGLSLNEPLITDPAFLLKTRSLVGADRPEHSQVRALIRSAFAPSRMQALEERIRCMARERIRGFLPLGAFELVEELAVPLPMHVIAMLLGVDPGMVGEFGRWADILVTWGSPECRATEEEVLKSAAQMHDYFSREIRERSRSGGDDLISILSRGSHEENRMLATWELIAFARLLLVAGTETTTHLIGNTVIALLDQAGLWNAVRRERERIPDLIEESLRYDSPVPSLMRRASAETSLGGVTIRKNEIVLPLLGSANHDEEVFQDPEQFKLNRASRPHLRSARGLTIAWG